MADTATGDAGSPSLADQLLTEPTFARLISDSRALVQTEIGKQGMTIRAAVSLAQKAKPDLVERGLREMMPGFVRALEPFYVECRSKPSCDFRQHLIDNDEKVADAMLGVADRRADKFENRIVKSGYGKLRGRAQREIVAAMPGIAEVIARHAR